MAGLTMRVTGLDKTTQSVDDMRRRMSNLEPVLRPSAESLRQWLASEVFGRSTAPSGSAWAPREDGSAATLGPIARALVAKSGAKVFGVAVEGDAARYAGAHQAGAPARGLPARPFMPEGTEPRLAPELAEIRDKIHRYVSTGQL